MVTRGGYEGGGVKGGGEEGVERWGLRGCVDGGVRCKVCCYLA